MSNSSNSKSSPTQVASPAHTRLSSLQLRAGTSYRTLEQRMVFDAAMGATLTQAAEQDTNTHAEVTTTALAEMDQHALVAALTQQFTSVAVTDTTFQSSPSAIDQLAAHLTISAKFLVETPVMEPRSQVVDKVGATPICIMEPERATTKDDPAYLPLTASMPTTSSIVFVDSRVADAAQIIAHAPVGSEIVLIDARSGGLEQIAAYLANRSNVDAIHIISHGSSGALEFGQDDITGVTLASHQAALAAIGQALSADGDILLYGCDVAQGEAGQSFVDALAKATGADVAASTDETGAAAYGGNWSLELRTGLIEAGLINAPEWNGLLAPLIISTTAAPTVTGATGNNATTGFLEGGVGFSGLWTAAGTVGGTTVDIRATVISLTGSTVSFFTQGDDLSIVLNGGATMTIKWEMFATGTNQTIVAVGTPNFQITDIDGVGGTPNTRETVRPQLNGLTAYTVDSPTNLVATTSVSGVQVSGTQNQNNEATSLTAFTWQNVSNWTVSYTLNPAAGFANAVFRHDGDGDFRFVAANTVSLLTLDLDANNSAATGTAYQATFIENGSAIAVVDSDSLIAQNAVLGPNLGSATVVLTNAQAGDSLMVGALPTGITGTVDTSVAGRITVTLTGSATTADYQAALEAVTFANNSENPAVTDRIIETFVMNTAFGTTSNTAISTIHVTAINDLPTTTGDTGFGITSTPIIVSVLSNDADIDGTLVPASVQIVGTPGAGQPLIVPGQGTWSVNTTTGEITFTPLLGFAGTPTPIEYTVADNLGGRSAPASVSITVMSVSSIPHLDLSGATPRDGGFLYGHNGTGFNPSWVPGGRLASVTPASGGAGLSYTNDNANGYVSGVASTTLNQAIAQNEYVTNSFTTLGTMPETWIEYTAKRIASGNFSYAVAISTDGFQTATLLSKDVPSNSGPVYDGNSNYVLAEAADFQLQPGTTYEMRVYFYAVSGGTATTVTWDDNYTLFANDPINYENTFTENGSAVTISSPTVQIEDSIDANMQSGLITLTNKQASDRLLVNGVAVTTGSTGVIGGVTYTVTETAGTIDIVLSGSASKAAYQNAIKAITFANTSDDPATVDRIIHATVNDGLTDSAVAVSTIHVIPLNDAPVVINPLAPGTPPADPLHVVPAQAVSDGAAITPLNVTSYFADPDHATRTLSVDTAALPPGLTFDAATGTFSGTPTAVASQGRTGSDPLGTYQVAVTATDPLGAAVTTYVTFNVGNVVPVAEPDARTTNENAVSITGNVLTNDRDGGGDADALLVASAINSASGAIAIGTEVTLPSGAKLTLNSNGTYTYKPNNAFNYLAQDETATDTFNYSVSDGQGGIATATVTITVDGRNDAPQAGVLPAVAAQDGDPVNLNLGSLFTDPDTTNVLTFTVTGLPNGLTFDPATGLVTGTLPNDASQLGIAPTLNGSRYLISVACSDGASEITRSFYYTVTNPAPIGRADANSVGEDGPPATGNVINGSALGPVASGQDSDGSNDSDPLTLVSATNSAGAPISIGTAVTLPSGATLTLNADGSYTYNPGNVFNGLELNETASETFSYTISDGQGRSATATVTITIVGANDGPVVINPQNPGTSANPNPATDPLNIIPDVVTTDGTPLAPINVADFVRDADGEPLIYALNPATTPAWVVINPTTGQITGTPPADASQLTNSGLPGVYLLTITATDPHGLAVTTTVTMTIGNVAPTAEPDAKSASEDGPIVVGSLLTNDTDGSNDTDPLTIISAMQGGTALTLDASVMLAGGGTLTLAAGGVYTFDPGTAYNGLKAGETATEVVTYTISDGNGGTATSTLTLTINGVNDGPVVIDPAADPLHVIPAVSTTDGATPPPVDVGAIMRDPDGEPLVFTASGLPVGLIIDPATGIITGTLPANASVVGPYTAVVTGTDPSGASVSTEVTYQVINLPPIAERDDNTAQEDGPAITGNVLTNDHDTAPDSDPLAVASATQNGNELLIGAPVTLAGGGILTLNSDGSYTFDPGTAYNSLTVNQTATETVSYIVSDGNGGTAPAVLVLTINGANDAPVVIDPANPGTPGNPTSAIDPLNIIPDVATTDGAALLPINVSNFVRDPEGQPLTYTLDPATTPAWVMIDPATGLITGTPPADASQFSNTGVPGIYLLSIAATDPHGAAVTTTVTLTINNVDPNATPDTNMVDQESPAITGNVLTNDGDSGPDSDPLTVVSMVQNGQPLALGQPVTLVGGGVLTLNVDGSYTFDPGTAYNHLPVGITTTETVVYTVSDGNGGTASTTLIITIGGINDVPTITLDQGNLAGGVDNAGFEAVFTEGSAPVHITNTTAHAFDVDANLTEITIMVGSHPDQNSEQINVGGVVISLNTNKSTTVVVDGTTFQVSYNKLAGRLSISALGSYGVPASVFDGILQSMTYQNTAFQPTGGDRTFTFTATDYSGYTSNAAVAVVTVVPVNDAPVIVDPLNPGVPGNPTPVADPLNIIPDVTTSDGTPLAPISVADFVRDPEGRPLTFALDPATTPSWVTIDPATGLITGTPPADASQLTNTGTPGVYLLAITITDPEGLPAITTVTLTIGNPTPVALNDAMTTAENTILTGSLLADNGLGIDTDGGLDTDPLMVLAVNGLPANVGMPVAGSTGGAFEVLPNGQYAFDPGTSFDYLAPGEMAVTTISYTITDGNGGTSTALVSVTVTGTNDTPQIVDPTTGLPIVAGLGVDPQHIVPPVFGLDGTPIAPLTVGSFFRDPDASQPAPALTVDPSQLPPGITFNPATGTFSGTPLSGTSQGGTDPARPGVYNVTVTATDPLGASVSTVVAFSFGNVAPVAINDLVSLPEHGPAATGSVLVNDHDGGLDRDVLMVTAMNGNPTDVGLPVTLPSGAILTLNADGSYVYDPNRTFLSLGAGTVGADTFSYVISDGNGGTASATVTLTIVGQNDAPVVIDPLNPGLPPADPLHVVPVAMGTDEQPITPVTVSNLFRDPDANDTVTLSVIPGTLPPGIAFDPATGTFSGTPTSNASIGGPANDGLYPVVVTATDSHGAVVTTIVTFDIRNQPPVALDDVAQTPSGTTVLIPVLANDRDGGNDTDRLTITTAASPDGIVTITPDGRLSFTPNPGFAGEAVITYTISDGQGGFATANVKVDVLPSNSYVAPVLVADAPAARQYDSMPSITTNGVVVSAVHDIDQLSGIGGSIQATGIISTVANQISGLGGVGREAITGSDQLSRSNQPWSLERMLDGPSTRVSSGFDVQGLTGFALRFYTADGSIPDGIPTGSSQIVLQSLVRDGNLTVTLSSIQLPGQASVVDFRVMQADGRPLPAWLDRAGQTLQGQRPADSETLKLKVIGILSDGTTIERDVIIQTISGEIRPLEGSKRADLAPTFSDQLRTYADAKDVAFERLQLALAG